MRVGSCHGRMHREATILRREHGGGLSNMEVAEVEDEVREREGGEVEEVMLSGRRWVGECVEMKVLLLVMRCSRWYSYADRYIAISLIYVSR